MAINPETQYPGKITPSSADYPYGEARNITTPGDGTGTPWEAALVNDLFGFQQALLDEASITPTGNPETATNSQYLRALRFLGAFRYDAGVTYAQNEYVITDTSIYRSLVNGNTSNDPDTDGGTNWLNVLDAGVQGGVLVLASAAAVNAATIEDERDQVYVQGIDGPKDGQTGAGAGAFWVDHADTTTADDGFDVLVSSNGKRCKRINLGIVTEYTDSTAGAEYSAMVFHSIRNGAKKEIARFQESNDGTTRYIFMPDPAAWQAANGNPPYPGSSSPLNEFHWAAPAGFASGRADVEFEALSAGLRLALEAPLAEDLFISFEHADDGLTLGMNAGIAKNSLFMKTGPFATGPGLMAWNKEDFRVNVGGGDTETVSTAEVFTVKGGIAGFQRDGGNPMLVNRTGTDGGLIAFFNDGALAGSIDVSGTTVSYNSFAGSHWSQLVDKSNPEILPGTVIETIDEMCEWPVEVWTEQVTEDPVPKTTKTVQEVQKKRVTVVDGQAHVETYTVEEEVAKPVRQDLPLYVNGERAVKIVDGERVPMTYSYPVFEEPVTRQEERREPYDPAVGLQHGGEIQYESNPQLAKFKVSDEAGSRSVYGVFRVWDEQGDASITSVGAYIIRIGKGVKVKRGDLLESAGDGTARPQADDIVRASTIGKVTAAIKREEYADGSYTVPCALYCG